MTIFSSWFIWATKIIKKIELCKFFKEKFACYIIILSSFRTFRKKTAFFFGISLTYSYLCPVITGIYLRGGPVWLLWVKYNKRLLLFGTLQNLPHSKRNKIRRISRKRLCDMHGRDLSGFCRLVVEPWSVDEISFMLSLCSIHSLLPPKISNTHQCIAYGQQES